MAQYNPHTEQYFFACGREIWYHRAMTIQARLFLLLFIVAAVFFIREPVVAGGCCFLRFEAVEGIAGKRNARISGAFVDPRVMMKTPEKPLTPLANQKIDVIFHNAQSGQACRLEKDTTDATGAFQGVCTSPIPGTFYISFTAPGLETEYAEMVSYSWRPIIFWDENNIPVIVSVTPTMVQMTPSPTIDIQPTTHATQSTLLSSTPMPTPIKSGPTPIESEPTTSELEPTTIESEPTPVESELTPIQESGSTDKSLAVLEEKLSRLEKDMAHQENQVNQVNWLTSIVSQLKSLVGKIFRLQ